MELLLAILSSQGVTLAKGSKNTVKCFIHQTPRLCVLSIQCIQVSEWWDSQVIECPSCLSRSQGTSSGNLRGLSQLEKQAAGSPGLDRGVQLVWEEHLCAVAWTPAAPTGRHLEAWSHPALTLRTVVSN